MATHLLTKTYTINGMAWQTRRWYMSANKLSPNTRLDDTRVYDQKILRMICGLYVCSLFIVLSLNFWFPYKYHNIFKRKINTILYIRIRNIQNSTLVLLETP